MGMFMTLAKLMKLSEKTSLIENATHCTEWILLYPLDHAPHAYLKL